ncbi:endonuclease III [Pedobacter sp. SYSU D00535]|uniref:endonuclease III n=1 Tax=Pedobacter sp. SYSU D00535 TaxID=2810308 RepID=UPI001A97D2EE|nr:endonuclease III [Pedobacter sp. SYSU D00535]
MLKKERFHAFVDYFSKNSPDAKTELNYTNPYELLVAVILSAQCTDKRINQITPKLFERFPDAFALAAGSVEEIFQYIRSVSYPNNKAKHLAGMAKILVEEFNGEVPSSMEDLQKLPGVGRKTANVITSIVFEAPALAVDTHVFRVANRLGLTNNATTPLAVEKQLVKYLPEETIRHSHHWLILHGRYICVARSPKCDSCPITHFCKFFSQQQTATALRKAESLERKKAKELKQRQQAKKLSTVLKKFEVKE